MNTIDTIRSRNIDTIGGLIEITKHSATFLDTAANQVHHPSLKTLFGDMAAARKRFVDSTSGLIDKAQVAQAEKDGAVAAWDAMYAELKPQVSNEKLDFVETLDSGEARLVRAFDNVAADTAVPVKLRQAVNSYLPTLRAHQTKLRERAWAKTT